MNKYRLNVRCRINMGRLVTDDDLKALDCYHETPVFCVDNNYEAIEIVDAAYELFCAGKPEFRCTESAELVRVA